jgi:hypothetical protein
MRRCLLGCAGLLAALSACRPPGASQTKSRAGVARAFAVSSSAELLTGLAASGRIGDYRLENDQVAIIVSAPEHAVGFARSGGNLIDAARTTGPAQRDSLRQMFLYLDDAFPRQAVFNRIEVARSTGTYAALIAHGVDSDDARLEIRHEYRLGAHDTFVTLRTTIVNRGAKPVPDYDMGDVIQWGLCERFVPGLGWRKGRLRTPWLAGVGDGITYGYTVRTGQLSGPHGSSWSDPIVATTTLGPGASATYERFFVIGDQTGVASVGRVIHRLRGEPVREVSGAVLGPDGHIAGARVELDSLDGAPLGRALTDEAGRFSIPVGKGDYQLQAHAPGRSSLRMAVNDGQTSVVVQLPAPSAIAVQTGGPAKVTLLGLDGTATPDLGPRHLARGAGNVAVTHTGPLRLPAPPGRYRVIASRGIEWTIAESEVELKPGAEVAVELKPVHVVDTTGYVSGDFHQHAIPSGDSAVSLVDRVISNVAEGVEIITSTDHNQVTDYGPVIAELGLTSALAAVIGVEATSETVGHFNAYPIPLQPEAPRNGAPETDGRSARQILQSLRGLGDDVVVQINHPRAAGIGYFATAGLDVRALTAPANMSMDFDAVEVLNGKRVAEVEVLLADWFWLLARGRAVTAVGNSDSHGIVDGEVGFARTYLGLGHDDPSAVTGAAVVDALKRRRDVIASNGPFVRVQHRGQSAIGRRIAAGYARSLLITVEVQAAPWVDVTSVDIYRNGTRYGEPIAVPRTDKVTRVQRSLSLPVGDEGSWYVFVARGERPLDPVAPGATPIAVTNPVWLTKETPTGPPAAAREPQ